MKDLFADQYMSFFEKDEDEQTFRKKRQAYYDYLSDILVKGEALLSDETDSLSEDLVYRKLTEQEEEELYFKVGTWLQSLN